MNQVWIARSYEMRQHGQPRTFTRHLPLRHNGRAAEARRQAGRDVFMIAQLAGIDQIVDIANQVMLGEVADLLNRACARQVIRMRVHLQDIVREFANFHATGFRAGQHDRHVRFALRHADETRHGNDVEPDMGMARCKVGHGRCDEQAAEPFGDAEANTAGCEGAVAIR